MSEHETLPHSADKVIITLLGRARRFLAHARSHVALPSDIDNMVAIHGLDNSVEYLLRILVEHLDIEARAGKNLDTVELAGLAGEIDRFLRDTYDTRLPYLTDIKRLRQVRNLVQHGAVDPGTELERFERVVTRFFDGVFKDVFGVAPDELELSHAIDNEEVRGHLECAEENLKEGAWVEAVAAARDAFESAYYMATRFSRIDANELPARMEMGKLSSSAEWFYQTIREELGMIRLGVPLFRFDRFQEYVRHLPLEHQASGSGHTVMQRPWSEDDARFCYDFAAEVALQWEATNMDPLYDRKLDKEYSFEVNIGPVHIPPGAQHMSYLGRTYENEPAIEAFIVSQEIKEDVQDLTEGTVYSMMTKMREDGELSSEMTRQVELLATNAELLTHSPRRWRVAFQLRQLPLTWKRIEFEKGEKVSESVCVNTCSAEKLCELHPIEQELAEGFVTWRERYGSIQSIEDVRRAPGISEKQVWWIARFSRAVP